MQRSKVLLLLCVGVVGIFLISIGFYQSDKEENVSVVKRSVLGEERAATDLPPYTFDDLFYNSDFSYSTFSPNWVSPTEYITRDSEGIKKKNIEDPNADVLLVSNALYVSAGANGYSISPDELFVLFRTSYTKQWRYSYNATYSIYSIADETLQFSSPEDVQYITWSPTGHSAIWVVGYDMYYTDDLLNIKQLTENFGDNNILSGVPDWVYEEEMVGTTNNIFWSPDSALVGYLVTDDTGVPNIEYSEYGDALQYPKTVKFPYPKAGTVNPRVMLYVWDVNKDVKIPVAAPTERVGDDHLFCSFYWYPDSQAFLVFWLNRISSVSAAQLCELNGSGDWECNIAEGGSEVSETGWIGDGGQPAKPVFTTSGRDYYASFSDDNGYWHIAKVDIASGTRTFLTTGTNVVTYLYGLDEANGWLYFRAAYPYARSRHLMRVNVNTMLALTPDQWQCITCTLEQDRCQYVSTSFSPTMLYASLNCGGPDVPMTFLTKSDASGEWSAPEVLINNDGLIAAKNSRKWYIKEYGEYESSTGITFNYQMYKPQDFDPNKKYPMMVEVYGGPGFQKVRDSWTDGWSSTHLVSQYDIITVNLDARGSGYRGDGIAHMMYKKLGQFEKKDNTELAQYLAQTYDWIDESRVAIWGWSYGGYATTHTISEGAGVFKCGLAVAPLATRFLYDSIHTERYMDVPDNNVDGYEKCSILNTNLDNFKRATYSIIHGTADDNVHFQNSALITKALIDAGVDFDDFFYADEAHSINYGSNNPAHIYKLLTKKTRQCFNLDAPPSSARIYQRLRDGSRMMKAPRKSSVHQESFEMMVEKPRASAER